MFRFFCLTLLAVLALSLPIRADESATSPDGKRVAQAKGKIIEVTEGQAGRLLMKMAAHKADITALVYAPDGKMLASGDKGGDIHFFDAATGKELRRIATPAAIKKLAFSSNGRTLTVTDTANKDSEVEVATGKIKPRGSR